MSKLKKIILLVIGIILIIVVALHFTLQSGLNRILNETVAPEIQKNLGISVIIKDARINLLRGTMDIASVQVGNPQGFQEPTLLSMENCLFSIRLLPLLRKTVEITDIRIDNSKVTITRNEKNQINTVVLAQSILKKEEKPEKTKPDPEKSSPEPRTAPPETETPNIIVENLSLKTTMEYIDHNISEEIFRLGFVISLTASGLSTFEVPDADWGSAGINAYLDSNTNMFVTSIKARIAPLTDPEKPSFTIGGTITSVDLTGPQITKICHNAGIQSDSASAEISLICANGEYKEGQSEIIIKFQNFQPTGKLAEKWPNFPAMQELVVPIPVSGTFTEPAFGNPQQIIMNVLIANFANNTEALLNSLAGEKGAELDKKIQKTLDGSDKKVQEEINKGIKKLEKFLNR